MIVKGTAIDTPSMGEDLGWNGKALVQMPDYVDHKFSFVYMKACVTERLTPETPHLEVRVSFGKNFTPLCLSSPSCINGYRRHTAGG